MNGYLSLQLEDSKDALDFIVERGMRQAVSRVSGQGEEITGPGVRDQPHTPHTLHSTHPKVCSEPSTATPFCLLCQELVSAPKTKKSNSRESPPDWWLQGPASL